MNAMAGTMVLKKFETRGLLLRTPFKYKNVWNVQQRPMRYDIQRPLEYRLRDPAGPIFGRGRTVNISRRGLLFQTETEVNVGSKIECVIRMGPSSAPGPDVNLHVQGVTVRSRAGRVAV